MFSILMSVYRNDDPTFLGVAFDSIIKQSLLPNQIVLVIDGPVPPEVDKEVKELEVSCEAMDIQFSCVRLETNVGLGLALNAGQNICTQDYIVRMDSDDFSRPNRLESLRKHILANPSIDVWGARIEEFHSEFGDLKRFRSMPEHHSALERVKWLRNPINHVTACLKKDALQDAGGYEDVLFFEDYFLWLKLFKKDYKFANIPETHVNVRVDGLIGRRHGTEYLMHELRFANRVRQHGLLPLWWMILFICSRVGVRLAPKRLTHFLYSSSRQTQ